MIVGFHNTLKNNIMSWQEELNKKLEAQREAYKQSIESGEVTKRKQAYVQKARSIAGAAAADGKGGKVSAERYNGKFLTDWAKENPEEFKKNASIGGTIGASVNKENGTGMYGWTDEQKSINGSKNSKVFWETASDEEKQARADKCSDSMKEVVEEKGWWNPHQYITPELQKEMTAKQVATKLNQREERIKELYDAIDTTEWFTVEYATEILSTISKNGASQSTARRMIHGWKEANQYYEFRKTERNELGKTYMQWRKLK
jgi:hypothetical protein